MEGFFILVGLLVFLGPLIFAIVAMTWASTASQRVRGLAASVEALRAEIEELRQRLGSAALDAETQGAASPQEIAAAPPEAKPEPTAVPEPATGTAATTAPAVPPGPTTRDRLKALEESLASRWLVWLGGVAIALGGVFLVKYVIDRGLLGPEARVTLGCLLGLALIFGGEYLRRRPLQRAIAAVRANYVPPALTASGLFTVFASVLAAYTLYGLLPPLIAFAGLIAIAALAVALSLLQGWFVALMGLVGAFATPALVSVAEPSAWTLFPYLLVVQVACLAVLRLRPWPWLALATLLCAAAWPVVWLATHFQTADALPLGLYLFAMAAIFLHYDTGRRSAPENRSWREEMANLGLPESTGWIAAVTLAVLILVIANAAKFSLPATVFVALIVGLFLVVGRRMPVFDGLAAVAGLLVLAVMGTWPLPASVTLPRPRFEFQGREIGTDVSAGLVPPELADFTLWSVVLGALVGIGGFAALWGAKRPAIWASASAAVPVMILVIAYWRIKGFGIDIGWAAMSLALAVVALIAAERVRRYRTEHGQILALGFYAAAVVAFLSLALTMTLQQAWLTVAFSIQLPALAWIHRRVPEKSIEAVALIVAGLILVRLVANYNVLDYALTDTPLTSWVLYGYGIPALMFFWAARLFRETRIGLLVTVLEAGAIAFAVLVVSLLIRLFIEGSLDSPSYRLEEQSLQSINWLAVGYVLAIHHRRRGHKVSLYGSRILLGLAALQVTLLQVWLFNPLITHDAVGNYPVVNILLLAYGVPAAFALRIAAEPGLPAMLLRGLAVSGFVLIFVYISLEVTRAFQGPYLDLGYTSNAEHTTYSLVWLAYAGLLLGLGIVRHSTMLRYVSLVVLLIAVLKVFLFDMSDLTGLLRAASFLGLGLSLVGIGYLYQRFVFRAPPGGSTAATD